MWTAAQLSASCVGEPTLALTPDLTSFYVTSAIAFDPEGNLWIAQMELAPPGPALVGFRASDITDAGRLRAAWGIAGTTSCPETMALCDPVSLAFDSEGYLWVGNAYTIIAYSPSTLQRATVGSGGALQELVADVQINAPDAGTDNAYWYGSLAFDRSGNLWAAVSSPTAEIVQFDASALTSLKDAGLNLALGPRVVTTYVPSGSTSSFAWGQLAFDASGNLWASAAGTGPNLYRFPLAAFEDGGQADVVATASIDASESLAFAPIPTGLPIRP